MAKKNLLDGRKRTSELSADAVASKKQELLKLKKQHHADELPTQQALPLESDKTESTVVAKPVEQPLEKPIEKPVTAAKAPAKPAPQPIQPAVSHIAKPEPKPLPQGGKFAQKDPKATGKLTSSASAAVSQEAVAAVSQLQGLYFKLEQAGSAAKMSYSVQARHDALVLEIKKMVQQKAKHLHMQGVKEDANLQQCQQFVDEVSRLLLQMGIKVNPLQLKKPK